MNVQRAGRGTADRLTSRKGLASRKARTSCPSFPGAERHKAEVCDVPLVLIGDILSPGGSELAGFTESSDILSDFPGAERHKAEVCDVPLVLIGDILSPDGSDVGCRGPMGARRRMCCRSGRFRSRLPHSYHR